MESIAPALPAAPVPPANDSGRPVLAHTTIRPLPKHSVKVAVLVSAALPIILLVAVVAVMMALNYNILNWME